MAKHAITGHLEDRISTVLTSKLSQKLRKNILLHLIKVHSIGLGE